MQSQDYSISEEELDQHPAFNKPWYHCIELLPGKFTEVNGLKHNIALTREMLKGCSVKDTTCLDIGTQNCLIPLLLERRGAATVVAQDLVPRKLHTELLRQALGAKFHYLTGMGLQGIRAAAKEIDVFPFDIVVFSGVLYHMFDPLSGLAFARSLVRDGGLMILETSAIVNNMMAAYFNAEGRFFPGTNYWQVSLDCLDYMLRFLRLEPIDCTYFIHPRSKRSPHPICRIAITCRAVSDTPAPSEDSWLHQSRDVHYGEFLDWDELSNNAPPVEYTPSTISNLANREDTSGIDVYETVSASNEMVVDLENQVKLKLEAIY